MPTNWNEIAYMESECRFDAYVNMAIAKWIIISNQQMNILWHRTGTGNGKSNASFLRAYICISKWWYDHILSSSIWNDANTSQQHT